MTIYIAPVSGGKDSQMVLALAVEKHGAKNVIALHNYTGIDHPLTYKHMEWMGKHYGVPIEFTSNAKYKDLFDMVDQKNLLPGRTSRFCTEELKIKAMNQWLDKRQASHKDLDNLVVLFGMRTNESPGRAVRYGDLAPEDVFSLRDLNPSKIPSRFSAVRAMLPIVDITTPAVYAFFQARSEPINPLYAKGHKRVGCYPCLLGSKTDFRLAARDPYGRKNVIMIRDMAALVSVVKDIPLGTIIGHDLDAILDEKDQDPFGFNDEDDGVVSGCQWCAP